MSSGKDILELLNEQKIQHVTANLQKSLHSDDTEIILESLEMAKTLFLHFLNIKNADVNTEGPRKEFITQMDDHYEEFKDLLVNYLQHQNDQIQETSLDTLMNFVQQEGKHSLNAKMIDEKSLPKDFVKIIHKLIDPEFDSMSLLNYFKVYLQYDDMKLFTLKSILEAVGSKEIDINERCKLNVFNLLCKIRFPVSSNKPPREETSHMFITKDSEQFKLNQNGLKLEFSKTWMLFLKLKLTDNLRKRALLHLPKRVLPHLKKPLLLTDFFTDSFSNGGMISLLALDGIFFLMKNYNLEYPEFYKQLYSLFDVDNVRSKYNRRFFNSSYLFLTSALLPEYIVAAFVKKLARLTLYVPIDVLFIIITFIRNMLIRHPSLKILINDIDEQTLNEDPFDFEEPDFEKCNAMQSSLWEIKALQTHWHPDISTKANFINSDVGPPEGDILAALDVDLCDVLEKEQKRKYKDFPLSTEIFNRISSNCA